ncbi:hypothetical protein TNCV_671021 [Trichonephila clavipes]|nr:hypothetical protein TNCV_671021 [Trichonephila clavipes]
MTANTCQNSVQSKENHTGSLWPPSSNSREDRRCQVGLSGSYSHIKEIASQQVSTEAEQRRLQQHRLTEWRLLLRLPFILHYTDA